MDFNTYKNFNWETLKRVDLGASYQNIFLDIHSILTRVYSMLSDFERTYSNFVITDRQKIDFIFNSFSILINKTTSFTVPNGETLDQGIAKSKLLQDEVKNFYEQALPKISELQTYFRSEQKANTDQALTNQQNQIQNLITQTQNTLNTKLSEIDSSSAGHKNQIDTTLFKIDNTLSLKIDEIDKSYKDQHQQVDDFLNQTKNELSKRLSELDQKLIEANKSIVAVTQTKANVEALNKSIKDFSLETAVSEYGTIFKNQAQENLKLGRRFGLAFILSIIGTIVIILCWFIPLLREFNQPDTTKGIEYYGLAFLIRLTVLFFVSWIIKELLRNCNSNFHMYNVNIHRHNSLQSFEILVKNNKLEENRDQIVRQISQTIFGEQDDGYLSTNKSDIKISDITGLISAIRK